MEWPSQTAVVTGGTEGIGRALVEALVAKGARVALCARGERAPAFAAELGRGGARVLGFRCDVSREQDVERFADFVQRDLGNPTLVINNAGIARWGAVHQMDPDDFDAVMNVNVRGMFLVTRAFLPAMLEAGAGTVVNVSSLAGRNGVVGGAAYSASKHAVLGFSKSLMLEVRKQGVRVIAVCPGSVDTAIFDKEQAPFATDRARMMLPADVAHAILGAVALPARTMVSELDIRPTNP